MKNSLRILSRISLISLIIILSACRKPPQPTDVIDVGGPGTEGLPPGQEIPGWEVLPTDRASIENMTPVDSSAYAPVYFAFDSYTVAPGEIGKIRAVADALMSSSAQAVILQGHTDERGSREYNLALGERRALAVRELLLTMGITSDQIQTLSMGEESPAVAGFDESAWSLNRRVQFQLMQ